MTIRYLLITTVEFVAILLTSNAFGEQCDSLECAIHSQNVALVDTLLNSGADPNAPINQFVGEVEEATLTAPLVVAIGKRNPAIVIKLLEFGADPQLAENRHTALTLSIRMNLDSVAEYIVDNNLENLNPVGSIQQPFNPLVGAIAQGNTEIIVSLLEAGADPNIVPEFTRLTPFGSALADGNEQMARLLLEHGVDLEKFNRLTSVLIYAVKDSNHRMTELLLQHQWDPNGQDSNQVTPLNAALLNCRHQERVVGVLTEYGANPCFPPEAEVQPLEQEISVREKGFSFTSEQTLRLIAERAENCWPAKAGAIGDLSLFSHPPLWKEPCEDFECAVRNNDTRKLETLLIGGGNPNQPVTVELKAESVDKSALEAALIYGSQEAAMMLMEAGAERCDVSREFSVLHRSITLGQFRVINFLLTKDEDRSSWLCEKETGLTNLHVESLDLDYEAISAELKEGKNADPYDRFGFSPLTFALALGAEDIATLLIDSGADIEQRTIFGHNLLHFAAIGNARLDLSGTDLLATLDISQADSVDGRTPLLAAIAGECPSRVSPSNPVVSLIGNGASKCSTDRYGKNFYTYVTEATKRFGKSQHVEREYGGLPDDSRDPGLEECPK